MSDFTFKLVKYSFYFSIIILFLSCGSSANDKNLNGPGARWGHVFIYNPADNNILLFGGTDKRGGSYFDDTWIWENNGWEKLDTPGPSNRGFSAAAYHEHRESIILHGGRGNERITYSDLWEYKGRAWTQIEESSLLKADHHQIVYLKDEKSLMAFGGWNGKDVLGDTWLWSDHWEKLKTNSPPKRSAFSMVVNENTQSVNLYGGLWINGQYADVWEWNSGLWTQIGGPYDNSSLDHHSMVYDNQLEKVVGFGGKNYRYVQQQTTFQIEDGKVESITNKGPSNRHSFGFTYDKNSMSAYLYGGKKYENGKQEALNDFWKWDGYKWDNVFSNN